MSIKLKPCPFCGGNNVKFDYAWCSTVPLIYCPDCTAVVSFGGNKRDTKKYSAEAWNRRAEDEQDEKTETLEDIQAREERIMI